VNLLYGVGALTAVVIVTVLVGSLGLRLSRTTSDFYVASRSVPAWLNASAISGEFLSAASFLGVAGLVLTGGADALWYPVGYTAGYLVLLAFVAAPLRRSGAYTVPDFAEARLESRQVRRLAGAFVVGVGWLYLVPQLQGGGLTLATLTGAPGWLGGAVVAVVVTGVVAAGGMRSVTLVQAFQYWLKLTALLVPAIFLCLVWSGDGFPRAAYDRPVTFREAVTVRVDDDVRVVVSRTTRVAVTGTVDGHGHRGRRLALAPGTHLVRGGTTLGFPAGARVPERERQGTGTDAVGWARREPGRTPERGLYTTYGLILATFLGTMGLPHVTVRFYTSPDGRTARRTALVVLGLVGAFYLLPPLYGALARVYTPDLTLAGRADTAVLVLPERMVGGLGGELLGALVAAGAFAAFLSTASGLTMSVAGVLAQDVLPSRGVRHFRAAAVAAMVVPLTAALTVGGLSVADAVGLAFAVSASAFCPLLVLGIWWRGLTAPGAVAGLLAGGGSAMAAVAATMADWPPSGWPRTLLAWPAVWSVPVGFLAMVAVSLATRRARPAGTDATMARLHVPERPAAARGAGA
jgi:Na+(H+)/acetate symporter ActP